jgi:hypothetical protein
MPKRFPQDYTKRDLGILLNMHLEKKIELATELNQCQETLESKDRYIRKLKNAKEED